MPAELKQLLEDASKSAGRSLNAEIVQRLFETFEDPEAARIRAEEVAQVRSEIRLMQDFMLEMFTRAGGDVATLEKSELFRRAGEVDARRKALAGDAGKPAPRK